MENLKKFSRAVLVLVLALATGALGSACATKKYVRMEVKSTGDKLSTRVEGVDNNVNAQGNQITELATLNKENANKIERVKGEVQRVDAKAGQAYTAADQARFTADKATANIATLDERFQNRNNYEVTAEKFVYFKFNSWKLGKEYIEAMSELAKVIKENPHTIVALEGHTDSIGNDSYNIQLGEKRLESVIRYLVVEQGVPMFKIFRMSYGEERPIAANNTKEGRSKNRSVVIRLLTPRSDVKQLTAMKDGN